eukprot:3198552-Rhodomonas_salina.1
MWFLVLDFGVYQATERMPTCLPSPSTFHSPALDFLHRCSWPSPPLAIAEPSGENATENDSVSLKEATGNESVWREPSWTRSSANKASLLVDSRLVVSTTVATYVLSGLHDGLELNVTVDASKPLAVHCTDPSATLQRQMSLCSTPTDAIHKPSGLHATENVDAAQSRVSWK